jgi:hypothetical protein
MKKVLVLLLLLCNSSFAQTIINADSMELPSTWRGVRVPGIYSGYVGGVSSAVDNPANSIQYVSSDTCYRLLGTGIGSSTPEIDTLVFPNITGLDRTKRYTIRFKLASIGYNPSVNGAAGIDLTDTIKLEWSASNGAGWLSEIAINGNNNALWGFGGTGVTISKIATLGTTYYSSSTVSPIKEVNLTLPLNVAQLKIRITMRLNAIGESFLIDDLQVIAPVVLPVELESFTASIIGNKVQLKWRTISETNNDYFSIYRSSHGLEYWQLVANVQGTGNSSIPNNYTFIDPYPVSGLNYYVLMQTDYDGRREQFPPIVVMFAPTPTPSVWDRYNFLGQKIK